MSAIGANRSASSRSPRSLAVMTRLNNRSAASRGVMVDRSTGPPACGMPVRPGPKSDDIGIGSTSSRPVVERSTATTATTAIPATTQGAKVRSRRCPAALPALAVSGAPQWLQKLPWAFWPHFGHEADLAFIVALFLERAKTSVCQFLPLPSPGRRRSKRALRGLRGMTSSLCRCCFRRDLA